MICKREIMLLIRIRSQLQSARCRFIHSTVIQAESSPASSMPKRLSKNRSDSIDGKVVDLVGPPDFISNIRPMIYAPRQLLDRKKNKLSSSTSAVTPQQPHPYSPHEFHQTAKSDFSISQKKSKGFGIFQLYRKYVDHVCDRVEEAEMKLRLSKLTTDSTTQRFWRDNNIRFSRDMQAWAQNNKHDQKASIEKAVGNNASIKIPKAENNLITAPSSESDFYATWLKANAKRNKAYNVLVWKQAFDQIKLGARVSIWSSWLKILRTLEG